MLRDLANFLTIEDGMPFEPWREALYEQFPKRRIVGAVSTVDDRFNLRRPPSPTMS